MDLVGHIFFPTKGPAVAHQFSGDNTRVNAKYARYVIAIIPDSLASGVDMKSGALWDCQCGFWFEKGVFDSLSLEWFFDQVR